MTEDQEKGGINAAQVISWLTCLVIPIAAFREYWLFRSAKDEEGKQQSPCEYLKNQYQDSIFEYLEEDDPSLVTSNDRVQQQPQGLLQESLLQHRESNGREDDDADSNGSQEIKQNKKMWFSAKQLFWMSVFWNIFSIPLNSVSPTIFGLQDSIVENNFQDRMVQTIACSITSLFLQLFLNISLLFYGFVIQGQGVFLLLSEKQCTSSNSNESHTNTENRRGNDEQYVELVNDGDLPNNSNIHPQKTENNEKIKEFLKSCMRRALVLSICFELMLIFTWIRYMIAGEYNPELLSKNTLFLICRQVMTFFITYTTKSSFLNPNMLRQQKTQSTYTYTFSKYFDPEMLWKDYISMFGENNARNHELFEEFLKQRSEQAKNYVERVEKILSKPDNNLSRLITNNQQHIQFQLKAVFIWLLGATQICLLVLSCYFYIEMAQPNYFSSFNQNKQPMLSIGDFVDHYYHGQQSSGQQDDDKKQDFLVTSDSTSIIVFNTIIVLQSISMAFVRSAFVKTNLLNNNARSQYV